MLGGMTRLGGSWAARVVKSSLTPGLLVVSTASAAPPAPKPSAQPSPSPATAANGEPALSANDQQLAAKVARRAASANLTVRADLARQLLELARVVQDKAWVEQRRARVVEANTAAGYSVTPAQLQAQLETWRTEHLARVLDALQHVPTSEVVQLALATASDAGSPLPRRKLALKLLDRVTASTDATVAKTREAARAAMATAEQAETGPTVARTVAAMRPSFRLCYQEQLTRSFTGDYAGRVTFTVQAAGSVASVSVQGLPADFARCVERVVLASQFEVTKESRKVAVPLRFVAPKPGAATPAACFEYAPAVVTISGVVESQLYPGPPNYESIAKGDKQETFWFLKLDEPVCTESDDVDAPARIGIRRVQLVLDPSASQPQASLLNKRAIARGSLFTAHTGRHHADVLIDVTELAPAPQQ